MGVVDCGTVAAGALTGAGAGALADGVPLAVAPGDAGVDWGELPAAFVALEPPPPPHPANVTSVASVTIVPCAKRTAPFSTLFMEIPSAQIGERNVGWEGSRQPRPTDITAHLSTRFNDDVRLLDARCMEMSRRVELFRCLRAIPLRIRA